MKLTKQQQYMKDNGLTEPPKCQKCDNLVKWSTTNNGYFPSCCTDCRRNKLSKEQQYLKDNGLTDPPKCKMCDNLVKWTAGDNGRYRIYCSHHCTNLDNLNIRERVKATNLVKYGHENPSQSEEIRDKIKATNLERYGHTNPRSSDVVKDKIKATNLVKYGYENPRQSEEIQAKIRATNLERYGSVGPWHGEKMKVTNLERYGSISPFGSEAVQAKSRITNLERYGSDHPWHSDNIKQTNLERYGSISPFGSEAVQAKSRITNLERYGNEHPWHSDKIKQTNLERYGVEYSLLSDEMIEKKKATNLKRYGSENPAQRHMVDVLPLLQSKEWMEYQYYTQEKTLTQIGKELGVWDATVGRYAKYHNIEIRPNEVGSSYPEREWIESIMESEGIYIQYSGNGGQYQIPGTNWRADGYCAETNTVYEYHGSCWHGNPRQGSPDDSPNFYAPGRTREELYQKTKEREQKIIDLGYNLVVMWDDGVNYSFFH